MLKCRLKKRSVQSWTPSGSKGAATETCDATPLSTVSSDSGVRAAGGAAGTELTLVGQRQEMSFSVQCLQRGLIPSHLVLRRRLWEEPQSAHREHCYGIPLPLVVCSGVRDSVSLDWRHTKTCMLAGSSRMFGALSPWRIEFLVL